MDVHIHRYRAGSCRGDDQPDTRTVLESLTVQLPDRFLDRMTAVLPLTLRGLGEATRCPVVVELAFPDDANLELGPLPLRLAGATRLVLRVGAAGGGRTLVVIDVLSGALVPVSMTRFAHQSGLRSVRWLSSLSASTDHALDGALDVCAAVVAGSVDQLKLLISREGSAVANFDGGLNVPVFLSISDVARVFRDLLGSSALAAGVRSLTDSN